MTVNREQDEAGIAARDMHISLREARLVVERLLVVAGMPLGMIPAIRDFVIDAEGMGLGAFARLRDDFDGIKQDSRLTGLRQEELGPAVVHVDAGGRSGLLLGPDVADLAIGLAYRNAISALSVTGVRDPAFLQAVCTAGPPHGASLCILPGSQVPRLAVSAGESWAQSIDLHPVQEAGQPPSGAAEHATYGNCLVVCTSARSQPGQMSQDRQTADTQLGPYLGEAVEAGFILDQELWWWLYHESGQALTPDSPLSRRHTGASVLDTYGNIMGEIGEDWEGERAG